VRGALGNGAFITGIKKRGDSPSSESSQASKRSLQRSFEPSTF
jgi:hypothetical protein